MKELGVKQRSLRDLRERVFLFKRTIKQWFYYAGLKYLQTHELSEAQELFLANITDFFVEYMDKIDNDSEFLKKIKLAPVSVKSKR